MHINTKVRHVRGAAGVLRDHRRARTIARRAGRFRHVRAMRGVRGMWVIIAAFPLLRLVLFFFGRLERGGKGRGLW